MEALARLYLSATGGDADRALRLALADALATVQHVQAQVSRGYSRGANAAPVWVTPLACDAVAVEPIRAPGRARESSR